MSAATKFFAFISQHRLLSAKDILLGTFSILKDKLVKYSTPNLAAINDSLFRYIETKSYPEEAKSKVAANLEKYYDLLQGNNLREAQAHFANIYSGANYPQSIVFVLTECRPLYQKITEFIKSIGQ